MTVTNLIPPTRFTFTAPDPEGNSTHDMVWWEWGNAEAPPLVCVHGLTRNGRDFDFLANNLADHFRIIAPDVAGRGQSAPLAQHAWYDNATYLRDVLALTDHLRLEQFDWIGTSMGGIIGMMMAALVPDKIRRMVLNDVGFILPKAGLERIATYVGRKHSFHDDAAASSYLRVVMEPFGVKHSAHWEHILAHTFVHDTTNRTCFAYDPRIGDAFREKAAAMGGVQDVDLRMLWQAIQIPILLLRGTKSDILPRDIAVAMIESHPQASLVEFEGIGHAPTLMEDDQIHAIRQWLLETAPLA